MRLFLDTNVLIDYYSRREPYFDDCVKLRIMDAYGDAELWVSSKAFADIFCVLKKAVDPFRLQQAFLESFSFFKICSLNADDIRLAAEAAWPDFEDCLVDICAQKVRADYLLTRDIEGFSLARTPVKSPAEFASLILDGFRLDYDETLL